MQQNSNVIDTIINAASIEEVIGEKISIFKKGSDYKAICPFHDDTKPSLSISVKKQMYKCFSCGAGGNVFTFLQEYDKITFPEALKILANKYNIPLKTYHKNDEKFKQQQQRQLKIKSINEKACEIFNNYLFFCLQKNKPIRNYINQRKISPQMIKQFKIGCTLPKGKLTQLLQKKYSLQDLILSGLMKGDNNNYYEAFLERLIFPIENEKKEVVGFGGRTLNNHNAKYINSSENLVFKKYNILYGLSYIQTILNQQKVIYVVEGYLDVIACQMIAKIPAVAPLGTSLTGEHVQKIKRYVNKAVLIFDGDEAGKKAALRSCQLLLEQELNGEVVLLPNGSDPFDLLNDEINITKWTELLQQRVVLEEYIFSFYNVNKNLSSTEKNSLIREIVTIFNSIQNKILKEDLIKKLAVKMDLSVEVIQEQMKKTFKKNFSRNFSTEKKTPSEFFTKELEILILLIFYPAEIEYFKAEFLISLDDFTSPVTKHIYQKLLSLQEPFTRRSIMEEVLILFENNKEIASFLLEKINRQKEIEKENILITILKEQDRDTRENLLPIIIQIINGEEKLQNMFNEFTPKGNLQKEKIKKKILEAIANKREEILKKVFYLKKKKLEGELKSIKEQILIHEQQQKIEKITFLQNRLIDKKKEIQKLDVYLRK